MDILNHARRSAAGTLIMIVPQVADFATCPSLNFIPGREATFFC